MVIIRNDEVAGSTPVSSTKYTSDYSGLPPNENAARSHLFFPSKYQSTPTTDSTPQQFLTLQFTAPQSYNSNLSFERGPPCTTTSPRTCIPAANFLSQAPQRSPPQACCPLTP